MVHCILVLTFFAFPKLITHFRYIKRCFLSLHSQSLCRLLYNPIDVTFRQNHNFKFKLTVDGGLYKLCACYEAALIKSAFL
jgi:hypothetical protein